jgi:hypothetical protein
MDTDKNNKRITIMFGMEAFPFDLPSEVETVGQVLDHPEVKSTKGLNIGDNTAVRSNGSVVTRDSRVVDGQTLLIQQDASGKGC